MSAQYTVGQLLPNGATVTSDSYVTLPDGFGTTVETMDDSAGNQTIINTPGTSSPMANQIAILTKAQAALAANSSYLAVAVPTTAQTTAQIAALTRAVNALIYITLQEFHSTAGT